MIYLIPTALLKAQRFGQIAATALLIGSASAAIIAMPLGNLAHAGNGNGNGGGNGHGDHGGGHGNGGGQDHGGGQGNGNSGSSGNSGKSADGASDDTTADTSTGDDESTDGDDGSLAANKLGKLNGFMHAAPSAIAHAAPNSAVGQIAKGFKELASDYAAANTTPTDPTDPDATPPSGPSIDDLGAKLADATNKRVTANQVQAIIDRLAKLNPDNTPLNDLATTLDAETAQDIADSANAHRAGESTDPSDDDETTEAN